MAVDPSRDIFDNFLHDFDEFVEFLGLSDKCIEIMKLHITGTSQYEIAEQTGLDHPDVRNEISLAYYKARKKFDRQSSIE